MIFQTHHFHQFDIRPMKSYNIHVPGSHAYDVFVSQFMCFDRDCLFYSQCNKIPNSFGCCMLISCLIRCGRGC